MSKKLKTFTQTSNKSYDRHIYHVKAKSGKVYVFDNYEMMRAVWMQQAKVMEFESVEVIDVCQYE